MNQFIYYPKCSTCKDAKRLIEQLKIPFAERDIVKECLNQSELQQIIEKSGLDINKFFNTSGLKYKALNLKEKLPKMSTQEKLAVLASDGMLVKRPILVLKESVIVGKKEEAYKKAVEGK